jgi:SHS2 domain-containing protein
MIDLERNQSDREGHRVRRDTAEFVVESWAPSRSRCLEELVRGVVETFADAGETTATREIPLEVGSALDEDVVTVLLADVCHLRDADGLVVVDLTLEEEDDGNFDGTFIVAPLAAIARTVTSPEPISSSDVLFVHDGSLWRARVVVHV